MPEEDKDHYKGEFYVSTQITANDRIEKLIYTKEVLEEQAGINLLEDRLILKYTLSDIDQFQEENLISENEAETLRNDIKVLKKQREMYKIWLEQHPEATEPAKGEFFTEKIIPLEQDVNKMQNLSIALRILIAQKKAKKPTPLFKNIPQDSYFGITKSLMDRIFYLPLLLEAPELYHMEGIRWEIRGNSGKSQRSN